ncbi:hypothetical protein [Methanosphaera sp. BMS]|nr:hypothetical protein [Methanosphaera sp. BMS]
MEVNMTSYNQLVRAIENATNYGFTSYKLTYCLVIIMQQQA